MLTKEQLEERRTGIGGSDVAAILGLSKWKTAHELYLEKVGEIPVNDEQDTPEYIHFGNVLEDVVAKEFERRNDLKVQRRNEMFRHKEHPFMLANIDRKIVGLKAPLECKTSGAFMVSEWGPDGSDQFPDYYQVQLRHYMNVLGHDEGYLAVLIGGNHYRQYYITEDQELSEMIMAAEVDFWRHVENREPPPMVYEHPSTADMLARLHPGTNGQTIFLPDSIVPWQRVKEQAQARIKEDETVVDACNNRIKALMGDAAVGVIPDCGIQYKRSEVSRKAYSVDANKYMSMRQSKYTEKK